MNAAGYGKYGNAEVVKLLLEAGADVNAENNNGMTALKVARKRGHHEIVQLLRKAIRK